MIRLGLRLTLNGGKEAAVRLVVTAAAVAMGVCLLLFTLAGFNAVQAQNTRAAWLDTSSRTPPQLPSGGNLPPVLGGTIPRSPSPGVNTSTGHPLWWLLSTDQFESETIYRVDVAATAAGSPVPPGISHLPGPGQFYASPALSKLLSSTSAALLGDRFPGRLIGTIGPSALPSPDSLIIVIGHRSAELSQVPRAEEVSSIATVPGHGGGPNSPTLSAVTLKVILAVGLLALLVPVLIFIGTATRIAAARREQRFAAMRLVGATPRQVSMISAVEASIAALTGVLVGFVLFYLLRPALLHVPFTGEPFAPGDLSLGLGDVLVVAIGVPAAAVLAARLALRRVQISPLGVSRRVTPSAPRAYRMVPLVAGVAELAYFVGVGHPTSTGGQIWAYFAGCLLIMAGLVIAGPWLTKVGSRMMARRTSRLSVLIAGRRLADNPRAAFRAISGLIVALFVTSVSVGIISTIVADHGAPSGGAVASDTLVDQFMGRFVSTAAGPPSTSIASIPNAVLAELRSIGGVQGVTVIHSDPLVGPKGNNSGVEGVVSCAQLSGTPALGRCAAGADAATITPNFRSSNALTSRSSDASTVWPAVAISAGRLQRLPVESIVVGTNGSSTAIERARTVLEVALPYEGPPSTIGGIGTGSSRTISELRYMTDVVILASLLIAGCSLAVSVAAGVSDRKRPFSLLRLTGVPLAVLRRVVALEAAVPLIVISVVSAGMGFLAADLFLRSELGVSLRSPGIVYYLIVIAGLAASLGTIACTLPLIERITGPEIARNE
ncbi:MAG: FtsX-like permease family protein [Acidimicrobiales bacterium]|jgi:hypothetical protein